MKKLITCLALSSVLFTGCTFMQKSEGIIKVNDTVITKSEFDSEFNKMIDSSVFKSLGGASNFKKADDNPMYNIFKEKIVNELIVKSLIDAEIAKRNIVATKEDVQNELKGVIDKVGSNEELNRILKQRGVSNSDFMNDLKTQVKIKKLVDSMEKINVTDNDAKAFYNTNKNQFVHGEQVRASHILISANTLDIIKKVKEKNPDMDPAKLNEEVDKQIASQKAIAENILADLKNNPDNFEKIAKEKSDDKASGERGGELGFFPKEAMVPEFANAAFSMKPNTISETLVQTPYGFHIIKVTDRMEAGTTPYDKVKDEIKSYLETQKQIEVLRKFTAASMKTAKIEYLNDEYDPAKASKIKEEKAQNSDSEKKETK